MNFVTRVVLHSMLIITTSCSPDGGGSSGKSPQKPSSEPPLTPTDDATGNNCIPSAANNNCTPAGTGIEKCWNKLLYTQEAQECAKSGKLFNRIKKLCVDSGIRLKPGCSIPAGDLKSAQDALNTALGNDANPQLDQCGSYTVSGKEYLVAYVLAKKYTGGAEGFGTYAFRSRLLCYKPSTSGDKTCDTPDLLISAINNDAPTTLSCD